MLTKTLLVALLATALCHLSEQKPPRRLPKTGQTAQSDPDYSGCGSTYKCFGMTDDCLEKKACAVLLKTKPADSGADFQLYWKRPEDSKDGYVAAALSDDDEMGDDSVTIFSIPDKKSFVEQQGITNGHKGVTLVNVTGVDNIKTTYENGLLVGSWHRAEVTQVQKKAFNLKDNKYYILLAYGPLDDQGNLKHHSKRSVSKEAVSLEQTQTPTANKAQTTSAPTTSTPTTQPPTTLVPTTRAPTTQPPTTQPPTTQPPTTQPPTTQPPTTSAPTTKVTPAATTAKATTPGGNSTVTTESTATSGNETSTPSGKHSTTPATTQSSGSGSLIQSLGLAMLAMLLALQ